MRPREEPPAVIPPIPRLPGRQVTSSASDLSYHLIEAGEKPKPLILLLHGFPELAYSWRKIMPALAHAGYYVVAFDQRGYGRTTGWDTSSFEDVDLRTFSQTNLMRDVVVLVQRLGYHTVECVIGHDFGGAIASLCGLTRPDMFRRVILMGYPFQGLPKLPSRESPDPGEEISSEIHRQLANLPLPRKHYQWYYSSAAADIEMSPSKGLDDFLRGYFHLKSADAPNGPHPLEGSTADDLSELPIYYMMHRALGMRETVSSAMSPEERRNAVESNWLTDLELKVYVDEFGRTGFQGGLNWYRVATNPRCMRDLDIFAGKKIQVPLLFIAGRKDWLPYLIPGSLERMHEACSMFEGEKWIEGAGHWVQQEQPERVIHEVLDFLRKGDQESVPDQQDIRERDRLPSRAFEHDGGSDMPSQTKKVKRKLYRLLRRASEHGDSSHIPPSEKKIKFVEEQPALKPPTSRRRGRPKKS